ncbi:MAG TPA: gamma-glutamylcyclotransferase family protein [Polyangiaceae bacterium]|nr:gamma-glutamylcyclotransferase family protein [Polyangiaceae bacterium]
MDAEAVPQSVAAEVTCLLFVYGSLKRGQANHRQLRGARFIAAVRTVPAFALRELAGYPALVPGSRAIAGELYEVPTERLAELDEFEGNGYARGQITLACQGLVIAYLARDVDAGLPLTLSEWPEPAGAH